MVPSDCRSSLKGVLSDKVLAEQEKAAVVHMPERRRLAPRRTGAVEEQVDAMLIPFVAEIETCWLCEASGRGDQLLYSTTKRGLLRLGAPFLVPPVANA